MSPEMARLPPELHKEFFHAVHVLILSAAGSHFWVFPLQIWFRHFLFLPELVLPGGEGKCYQKPRLMSGEPKGMKQNPRWRYKDPVSVPGNQVMKCLRRRGCVGMPCCAWTTLASRWKGRSRGDEHSGFLRGDNGGREPLQVMGSPEGKDKVPLSGSYDRSLPSRTSPNQ